MTSARSPGLPSVECPGIGPRACVDGSPPRRRGVTCHGLPDPPYPVLFYPCPGSGCCSLALGEAAPGKRSAARARSGRREMDRPDGLYIVGDRDCDRSNSGSCRRRHGPAGTREDHEAAWTDAAGERIQPGRLAVGHRGAGVRDCRRADGDGAPEACGRAVLELPGPASGPEDAEVVLDAPARTIPGGGPRPRRRPPAWWPEGATRAGWRCPVTSPGRAGASRQPPRPDRPVSTVREFGPAVDAAPRAGYPACLPRPDRAPDELPPCRIRGHPGFPPRRGCRERGR